MTAGKDHTCHMWEGLATHSHETSQLQKIMTKNTPKISRGGAGAREVYFDKKQAKSKGI